MAGRSKGKRQCAGARCFAEQVCDILAEADAVEQSGVTEDDILRAIEHSLKEVLIGLRTGDLPRDVYDRYKRYRLNEITKALETIKALRRDLAGTPARSTGAVDGRTAERMAAIFAEAVVRGTAKR